MSASEDTPAGNGGSGTGSGRRKSRATTDPGAADATPDAAAAPGQPPEPGSSGTRVPEPGSAAAALVMEAERHLANYQIANPGAAGAELNKVRTLLQQAAAALAEDSEGDGGYATGGTSG